MQFQFLYLPTKGPLNAHAQILRKQNKNTLSFIKYNEIK